MTEIPRRRHGLEPILQEAPDATGAALSVRIRCDVGHLNLRGHSHEADFVAAVETGLQQSLPLEANTLTIGPHEVYWLGPDEWQIVAAHDALPELAARLGRSVGNRVSSLVDVSGGQIMLELTGPGVRRVLASGCTLDFHTDEFRVGDCAQSAIAKANVLIGLVDAAPVFHVTVRRSFSDYVLRWLMHTAGENGARISDD